MGTEQATVRISVVNYGGALCKEALCDLSAEELARQAKRGCQASFAELVRRFAPRLQVFLCQKTNDHHDAEDLVQDTFVKAYQNIGRYRESYRFSTWLFTIGTRLAVSHHRKKCVRLRPVPAPHERSSPVEAASNRQRHDDLWTLARDLSGLQYQVLWLKYGQEMSIKEIARTMRRSQVSVKVLLYRARVSLLKRWNREYHDEADVNAQEEEYARHH